MTTRLSLRAFHYWAFQFRRTWLSAAVSSVVSPVLYLAAMGVGLGSVADHGSGSGRASIGGVPYLTFIAPGLLAATVMQAAVSESSYPVIGSIK